jgi:hypothetical protein
MVSQDVPVLVHGRAVRDLSSPLSRVHACYVRSVLVPVGRQKEVDATKFDSFD